ncbi:MAG TPA: hypothetical protein VNE21_04145, partial [Mycobacteriales bacterium]|nr:hypothetical protein [Mycobacteriales bacterium]
LLSALSRHEARAGLGLVSLLRNLTLTPRVAEVVAAAAAAAVLAGASRSYSRHGDERVVFAAAVIAALLCTPVLWSHYLVLLAAPLLGLRRPEPALAVLAVGSWALAPPHGASAVAVLVGTGVLLVVAGKVWSRPLASYRSRAPRGRLVGIAAAALATGVLGAAALSGPGRHWLTTVAPGVVNAAAAVAGCLAVLAASNRAGRGATPRAATEGSSGG